MPKKSGYGHPGSSGQAQSGGINHTFGGGKGGTKGTRGATSSRKTGSGRLNNGLNYNVRTTGGDDNKVPFAGRVGMPPPIAVQGSKKKAKVTVRPPHKGGNK